MRIGRKFAARCADPAEPHATRAENDLECILRSTERSSRAPFASQRGTQSGTFGTRSAIVNCIHVVCTTGGNIHAVRGRLLHGAAIGTAVA
jgi:hypothetical protein